MQRLRQPIAKTLPGGQLPRRRKRSHAAGADIAACTPRLTTLAPAFGQALPSVEGVPLAYSHEFQAELVYDLCAALVRENLGTDEDWLKCGEDPLAFATRAIMVGIGEHRWNLLKRNVEYHLQVSDVTERDGFDAALESGQLVVTIESSNAGYLKIGPAIEALEEEAEGLGAAFYWALTYALYRVMRIYNHDDAMQYEERMREYAEEEDQGNGTQYELPEVEKALPECIRESLTHDYKERRLNDQHLLHRCGSGRYHSWIERLRKLEQISRVRLQSSPDFLQSGNYDSEPLPSLLVIFKEQDAITASFDEESQYMLEGSSEPALGVIFSPQKPDEVRHAMRVVGRFFAFNQELFELIEELQEWEKSHAGEHSDRGELSLRAT